MAKHPPSTLAPGDRQITQDIARGRAGQSKSAQEQFKQNFGFTKGVFGLGGGTGGRGDKPPSAPPSSRNRGGKFGFGTDADSGRARREDGSLLGQVTRAQAKRNKRKRNVGKDGKPKPEDFSPGGDLSQQIKQMGIDLMTGKMGRYSDERVAGMKTELHQATFGRVKRMQRDAEAAAARRGIFRSGMSLRMQSDISRDAMQAYSKGVREIMMKKIDAEHEDKLRGADISQKWLSQKQNYELGKERNQIARQQIGATMASARMSAEVAKMGIRAANGRASARLTFDKTQAAVGQANFLTTSGRNEVPIFG